VPRKDEDEFSIKLIFILLDQILEGDRVGILKF